MDSTTNNSSKKSGKKTSTKRQTKTPDPSTYLNPAYYELLHRVEAETDPAKRSALEVELLDRAKKQLSVAAVEFTNLYFQGYVNGDLLSQDPIASPLHGDAEAIWNLLEANLNLFGLRTHAIERLMDTHEARMLRRIEDAAKGAAA